MKSKFAVRYWPNTIAWLWLTIACTQPESPTRSPTSQKAEPRTQHETAMSPSARSVAMEPSGPTPEARESTDGQSDSSKSVSEPSATNSALTAETVDLKTVIKPLLSRDAFKLDPSTVEGYFANIATLHEAPPELTWSKRFIGKSKSPWVENVLVDLYEEDGRWTLGQSQITWRPPKAQARALYDRLSAQVQAARGRKPNFGDDESKNGKPQRFVGWTWCKDSCEAIVALVTSGGRSFDPSVQIEENRPAVLLQVYTPQGP